MVPWRAFCVLFCVPYFGGLIGKEVWRTDPIEAGEVASALIALLVVSTLWCMALELRAVYPSMSGVIALGLARLSFFVSIAGFVTMIALLLESTVEMSSDSLVTRLLIAGLYITCTAVATRDVLTENISRKPLVLASP